LSVGAKGKSNKTNKFLKLLAKCNEKRLDERNTGYLYIIHKNNFKDMIKKQMFVV